MEEKKYRNGIIYFLTIIVVIIVYIVIYFYNGKIQDSIYLEKKNYEENIKKQPVNNLISIVKKVDPEPPIDDKDKDKDKDKNKDNNKDKDKKDDEKINTDDLFIYDFDETNGNVINLVNQFPIKDEVGRKLEGEYRTHDFELKMSKQATGISYVITIEKLDGSDFDEKWIKVYLENEGTPISNSLRSDGRVKTFTEYTKYKNKDNERILYEGIVSNAEALRGLKKYTLRMWVSEDLTLNNENYLSKTFKARVNVYAVGNYN